MTKEEEFILENQAKMFSLLAVLLADHYKEMATLAQEAAVITAAQIAEWKTK